MKQHIEFRIYGKVHGVGFRFTCMEAAYKHKIKGFVQNKKDRSVLVVAEGEEADMVTFREWCHKGPLWAKVIKVKESPGEMKDYKSFEIVRK